MQRFINTFCGGLNGRSRNSQPNSPTNSSVANGSLFVCLDDASTVCNPLELSSRENKTDEARVFTLAEHAKRVKLLRAKREQRLKRVSKSDAFKEATRTYETFGLGSFATWVNTEDGISAASDDEVTVMFCGDFCVPNLHTLDDMHSAFVRYVYLFRSLDARGLVFVLFLRVNPRANCEGAQINISEFVQLFNELFPNNKQQSGWGKQKTKTHAPADAETYINAHQNSFFFSKIRGEQVDAYAQVSNAQRMLDFYRWSNNFRLHQGRTHKCDPALNTDFIAAKLEQLAEANEAEGKRGFAFVIYDKKAHRLIVARDSTKNPMPLYWGLAPDGEKGDCLFISTEEKNELFSECFPASSPFPKGAVFVAEGTIGWIPGEKGIACGPTKSGETAMRGFRKYGTMPVRTIPRVNSSGQMCGNVFRVESFSDMIGDVVDVHDLKRHGSYPAMIQ